MELYYVKMELEVNKMNSRDISIINRKFKDLNPLVLGWQTCIQGHSYGPHIRSYYLIHYVCSGKGILENSQGIHPVSAGELFLIRPGEITTYTADAVNPWDYIWVGFDGLLAKALDALPCVIPYPKDTFFTMQKAAKFKNAREEFLAGQLFLMLSALLEHAESTPPNYVQQTTDFIQTHYMNPVRIEQIADMLGLNRRYLTRIFKQATGKTVQDFLIETRLTHAAEYLQQGWSVAETASLSGYPDAFHFSKLFKQRLGVSPREYKCTNKSKKDL